MAPPIFLHYWVKHDVYVLCGLWIVCGVLVGGVCVYIVSGMSGSLEHEEQVSVLLSSVTVEVAQVVGIEDIT